MGTTEGRSLAGVIAGVLLGVGIPQCVSAPVLGWSCIGVAVILLLSLYFGWPFGSLQIGVYEGSMEGVPLIAPLWYQVDQLRQTISQFHGTDFDLQMLWVLLPKAQRKRKFPMFEPLPGPFMVKALDFLVSTGELTQSNSWYRATNKKLPPWVRWKHGKDAKA